MIQTIEAKVTNTGLKIDTLHSIISFDCFNLLAGLKINWKIRQGKKIELFRSFGHLYIKDTRFIKGATYILESTGEEYQCDYVRQDGSALLQGPEMKCKYEKNSSIFLVAE